MKRQTKAYLLAFTAILFWSTVASAFKISLEYLDYKSLLFYSALTSLLILFIIVISNGQFRKLRSIKRSDLLISMLLGFFNPLLYYLILFKAYDILPAQEAMTLNYTWPLVLSLLSAPLLGQKLTFKSVIALLVSFSGILIIATNGKLASLNFTNLYGDLLAIGSSLIWALFWLLNVKSQLSETLKLFLNFFWGSIYMLIIMLITGGIYLPDIYGLGGALYIGAFEMGITFVFWLKAMQLTERTDKISQLVFLSPFLSLIFIHIFVGETIKTYTLGGLTLIVLGILIQQYSRKRKKI
ncbi:MAG: DMT family transporter [Bacteroidales bacterium]|nr:DMT family transporter [Bacteroidales bacterium]MCF8327637.1 DMT family transporter [Bacteroidales bacterium]